MNQYPLHNSSFSKDILSDLPLAMAYIPWQTFCNTYEPCKALRMGTIFPELCKPFCGKRGVCK